MTSVVNALNDANNYLFTNLEPLSMSIESSYILSYWMPLVNLMFFNLQPSYTSINRKSERWQHSLMIPHYISDRILFTIYLNCLISNTYINKIQYSQSRLNIGAVNTFGLNFHYGQNR